MLGMSKQSKSGGKYCHNNYKLYLYVQICDCYTEMLQLQSCHIAAGRIQ